MNSTLRSIAFWLIWLCVVFGTIWFIVQSSRGSARKPAAVERGAGAALLTAKAQTSIAPFPNAIVPPAKSPTRFFAVTASDDAGLTSGYSSEVSTTSSPVMLYWDAPLCTNVIVNYVVWRGTNSGKYTRSFPSGTNLSLRVPPMPPTNLVITVAGSVNWTATNPTGVILFTGRNLTIFKRYF